MSVVTQRWQVGAAMITSVVEHELRGVAPELFFPEASQEAVAEHRWLAPEYAADDGTIHLAVRAFVIEVGASTVVVDPCVGNGKQRAFPVWNMGDWPWLERFEQVGFLASEVDMVVHTHLHPDHVGWDTRRHGGEWVPTFANARYLYTQRELDFCRDEDQRHVEDVYVDSVAPIFGAGLGDIVAADADLGLGLRLTSTPGHTPGHVSLWVESEGDTAVVSGDLMYHPVQCAEPQWSQVSDWDADACRASRRTFLEEVSSNRALVLGTHFPGRCAGHIDRAGDAYRFAPDTI